VTVDLEPELVAREFRGERGALVRLEAPGATATGAAAAGDTAAVGALSGSVLRFQYNPESITRTRTGSWQPRKKRKTPSVTAPQEVRHRDAQGSSALLAESEQISLRVVFDATEAVLAGRPDAARDGVLPQLGFLEVLSTGKESAAGTDPERESIQPVRPDELLLVLGLQRVFPVVLTSLSITEQKYLPSLVPLRAQAELKFTVLEPTESAYRVWIAAAFDRLFAGRLAAADRAAGDPEGLVASIADALEPRTGSTP
jgi:hypothetical protein